MICLHITTLSENNLGFPANNATNLTDFVNNYKSTATEINSFNPDKVDVVCDKSYSDFKSAVTNWADVKYTYRKGVYILTYQITV